MRRSSADMRRSRGHAHVQRWEPHARGLRASGDPCDATGRTALPGVRRAVAGSGASTALPRSLTSATSPRLAWLLDQRQRGSAGAHVGDSVLVQPTGFRATITPRSIAVDGLVGIDRAYDATTAALVGGTAALAEATAAGFLRQRAIHRPTSSLACGSSRPPP